MLVHKSKLESAAESFIEEGDILITRTGAKAGATARVPRLDRTYCVSSHSLRLIPNKTKVDSQYLEAFLLSIWGKTQLEHSMTGAAQRQLQIAGIGPLLVPVPPLDVQVHLVDILEAARIVYRQKLQEADALLAGLDGFVLDALGLTLPPPDTRTVYAVSAHDAQKAKKLYPDFFHPERVNTIRKIEDRFKDRQAPRLVSIADDDGKGNCFKYIEGDVLFARLRPYLNKVYRAESDGVCSTEFHVIRVHKDKTGRSRLIPDYVAAVLRSNLVLSQTRHMMTGNTHPRLTNEDVVNLIIPNPDRTIQQRIADEVAHRRVKARQLRSDAELLWREAKHRFEEELLRPVPVPEESKTGHNKGRKMT
jgi:restriction endonuclease S subunit